MLSCNGRTRNAVSMNIWVCTRLHYFCPSPDFTISIVSQSETDNRCAPSCGGHKRKVRGTSKNCRPALRAGILPPTCKLLPTPLHGIRRNINRYSGIEAEVAGLPQGCKRNVETKAHFTDCMTSRSIAPSLVDGHLGPFLWSDAAARDGRDARDWLTGLATVGDVSAW